MIKDRIFFSFDVESIGLYGAPFAVGWSVLQESSGRELASGCFALNYWKESTWFQDATRDTQKWLLANIPELPKTHDSRALMEGDFAKSWKAWERKGAIMVADCPFPVEAKFLLRAGIGSYPLIDVASVRMAVGLDPLETCPRLPHELPAHNPLNDARQSGRLLLGALKCHSQIAIRSSGQKQQQVHAPLNSRGDDSAFE